MFDQFYVPLYTFTDGLSTGKVKAKLITERDLNLRAPLLSIPFLFKKKERKKNFIENCH